MSIRLSSLDDDYQSTFPAESQWLEALQDSVDPLLNYIQAATHRLPLPLAQATLQRPMGEARYAFVERYSDRDAQKSLFVIVYKLYTTAC